MPKPLMPYGSEDNASLIFKRQTDVDKRADTPSKQLAVEAAASSGGHLTKGGWGKLSGLDQPASRLVRRNAGTT